jgi:hypothetical protein
MSSDGNTNYSLRSRGRGEEGMRFPIVFKTRKQGSSIPLLKQGYQHIMITEKKIGIVEFYPFAIKDEFSIYFFSKVLQNGWHYDIYSMTNGTKNGYTNHENRGVVFDCHGERVVDLNTDYMKYLIDFVNAMKNEQITDV